MLNDSSNPWIFCLSWDQVLNQMIRLQTLVGFFLVVKALVGFACGMESFNNLITLTCGGCLGGRFDGGV